MRQLLLSEKYRPKNFDDVILLPRIRKIFEKGMSQNTILYGGFGTGKTTLARILIGKYYKDHPFMEINGSLDTSIDILRGKISDFCSTVYMGFDIDTSISNDSIKYIFIDECDRISMNFQDALKAYIEEFSKKNVRFILTTNHINKVSPGIRSRLIEVNFDCQSPEEEKYLKTEIYKKISTIIAPQEGFEISKEELIKIINKKFPDFRSIMIDVDNFKQTGSSNESGSTINIKLRNDLYSILFDKSKTYDEIYHFLMNNFGPEKIDEMISLFGRPFIEWSINEKKSDIEKLFQVNYIITEHTKLLETNTDPIVLGMTVIGKIRDIF